jgi:hypothetical protein
MEVTGTIPLEILLLVDVVDGLPLQEAVKPVGEQLDTTPPFMAQLVRWEWGETLMCGEEEEGEVSGEEEGPMKLEEVEVLAFVLLLYALILPIPPPSRMVME